MKRKVKNNNLAASYFSKTTRILLEASLAEDIGKGDVTTELLIPASAKATAKIISRQDGIFCGAPALSVLFHKVDKDLKYDFKKKEGSRVRKNEIVITLSGKVSSIVKVERTALNFLGHLSGVSTKTNAFVKAVKPYAVLILDTRKTTPLWRELEKYAVRMGGGKNHRFGLYDAIFIKENHRRYGRFSGLNSKPYNFEIEVRNRQEIKEALSLNPKVILFDNFKPERLKKAVASVRKKNADIILEASGGITIENVKAYARSGVDWISVGGLTHSVPCFDFSLLIND